MRNKKDWNQSEKDWNQSEKPSSNRLDPYDNDIVEESDGIEEDVGVSRSLMIVDELLYVTHENDDRRKLLYELRREILEEERVILEHAQTIQEAHQAIVDMQETIDKLTAPANRIGTLLGFPKKGIARVIVGGSEYLANVDSRLDPYSFKIGFSVLLNEAYVIVGELGYSDAGPIGKIGDILPDGRLRVGQEPATQAVILERSTDLANKKLKVGDEVRIDPNFKVALERLETQEVKDYYLEEVPDIPWEKIGGLNDTIALIKDTIELPILHPEVFESFQYSAPKGFLLHGPPGCGKTLIGKATAHNLTQRLKAETGIDVEGCFLHIKGPEILNMWLGESERKVREIFQIAREKRKDGHLSFVFIDEAESILGTRRSYRSHNIANTVVPMFCAEMDGIESLQDVVIILATNRPDLIDPAILRPGRIDRKIKVTRPDKDAAKDIFHIYLTPDLPIDPDVVKTHDGNLEAAVNILIDRVSDEMFQPTDENKFLEVGLRNGRRDVLYRGHLCSGAIIESIVQRAKESAIKRAINNLEQETGIGMSDLMEALAAEYRESDIFPSTDSVEDWLKLLDYDTENVVKVSPIRPEKLPQRKTAGRVI